MRCAEVQLLLSDYADGLADERGRRIVERHLQLCQSCREGAVMARQIGQQLLRLSLLPLGVADRVPRLRQRLEQKVALRLRWARLATFGALGLLVGLVAGLVTFLAWLALYG